MGMTVRELIKELLHADMDAEVDIAYWYQNERGDEDEETRACAVRIDPDPKMNTVYICSKNRKNDFNPL